MSPAKPKQKVAYKRVSSTQAMKIGALLYAHLHNVDDHSHYDAGWSDERIAEEAGCKTKEVTYRRTHSTDFLPLRKESKSANAAPTMQLVLQYNSLIDYLAFRLARDQEENVKLAGFKVKL